jgi:hypothetical protein
VHDFILTVGSPPFFHFCLMLMLCAWMMSTAQKIADSMILSAHIVSNALRDDVKESDTETRDPVCEHGIIEGDWCEECNREYKAAASSPDNESV